MEWFRVAHCVSLWKGELSRLSTSVVGGTLYMSWLVCNCMYLHSYSSVCLIV